MRDRTGPLGVAWACRRSIGWVSPGYVYPERAGCATMVPSSRHSQTGQENRRPPPPTAGTVDRRVSSLGARTSTRPPVFRGAARPPGASNATLKRNCATARFRPVTPAPSLPPAAFPASLRPSAAFRQEGGTSFAAVPPRRPEGVKPQACSLVSRRLCRPGPHRRRTRGRHPRSHPRCVHATTTEHRSRRRAGTGRSRHCR
jgi:hypothetical protein